MPQCLQVMRYIKLLLWQLTLDSGLYSLLFSEEVIFKRYNEGMLTIMASCLLHKHPNREHNIGK